MEPGSHKTEGAKHLRPRRLLPLTPLEWDRRPRLISLVELGSGVVTYDPTRSLGSGVVICEPVRSLRSGVVICDTDKGLRSGVVTPVPTQSLGSWVVACDPDNSLGSRVVTHDPSDSLGSGVVTHDPTHSRGSWVVDHDPDDGLGSGVGACDPVKSLGSGVVTHDPTHSRGSWVVDHDPDDGLGSGVGACDPVKSLGSGVVTHDPTHSRGSWVVDYDPDDSLGSGVGACDPVKSLGSGVVTHDPTHSQGSWVVAYDPANSLGSRVVTHDPVDSLGSGVVACDPDKSLGSGVVTHDPTHSQGSWVVAYDPANSLGSRVVTHDPVDSLGSGVVVCDPDKSLGSGVVTHDPTHSHGSWVVAYDPANSLGSRVVTHDPSESLGSGVVACDPANSHGSRIVTHDPTHSPGSGVKTQRSSGLGKCLYRRNTMDWTRHSYRNPSFHIPRGVNRVGGDRLANVPRRARGTAREFIRGTAWKVRMLSVHRPDNAGNTTQLVASENQEPRLDADRVAPNANGADRGRPSRSGARGQGGTESEDTDDSEPNTQEMRYYSDDGAESELGEPEGHGRSGTDAASRGESRQLVPEVGLYQRPERVPSPDRPRSVMSLDGLGAYIHRTQRLSGPYDGGVSQLATRSRPRSLDYEPRSEILDHQRHGSGEMADGVTPAAAPEAEYLFQVDRETATMYEYDDCRQRGINAVEIERSIQMGWIEDSRPHHLPDRDVREDWRFPGVVGLASIQPAEVPRNQDGSGRPSDECPRRTDEGASWFQPPAASEEQRGYQLGRPSVLKYGPDVLAAMWAGGRGEEYPDQHWAEPKKHQPTVVTAPTVHRDDGYQRRCNGDAGPTAWQTEEKRYFDREDAIRSDDVYGQANRRSRQAICFEPYVDNRCALEQQMERMRLRPQPREERPVYHAISSHPANRSRHQTSENGTGSQRCMCRVCR